MLRTLSKSFFATVILSLLLFNTVFATSWVDLTPEEVMERSIVIVQGKYNFFSEEKGSHFIWVGYDFNVDKVYKGNAASTIIAGIDGFDIGWVDEIQQNNGSFVLFLEQTERAGYLTPVGGPNGMIHIQGDEVQHLNDYERAVFADFLRNTKSYEPDRSNEEQEQEETNTSDYVTITIIAVVIGMALLIIYRRYKIRRSNR